MRVDDAMTREVVTVAPEASLKDAAALLVVHGISGLPVVDAGRLVGILSESDIVAKETSGFSDGELSAREAEHVRLERGARRVADAMTRGPVTASPWMSIWAAADLMAVNDVHRLPVLDAHEQLVGIVTRDDLVRAFARSDGAVERDIRDHVLPSVGLAPNALDVRVRDGAVTVTGEFESEIMAGCLLASMRLVPGVVEVDWQVQPAHAAA